MAEAVVASMLTRKPRFDPRPVHVEFVWTVWFGPAITALYTFVYSRLCIMSAADSVGMSLASLSLTVML